MKNLFKHLAFMLTLETEVREWWAIRTTPEGRLRRRQAYARFSAISQGLGGGVNPYLFTQQDSSAKTAHNLEFTSLVEQIVQYWLPHRLSGIINVCPWSTKGCRATCLHTSGRLGMAETAKMARVKFFADAPLDYMIVLLWEIERNARRVDGCGKQLAVRFNGTGDVPIEKLPFLFELVATLGLDVQWFDYTKGILTTAKSARVPSPRSDYYTVASATETTDEDVAADYPHNIVFVADIKAHAPLPSEFWGRQVVDGDLHDLRLLDRQDAVAVIVRAKGDARGVEGDAAGFVKAVSDA